MSDNLNIHLGERYPITVKVSPSNLEYENFTINDDSYVKIYNSSGGPINSKGELFIDNENKSITYVWDTKDLSIQQYNIVIWVSISYINLVGDTINVLLSSDNIKKNLVRSSKLE